MNPFLVYTAGPISGLSYEGATDWRKFVAEHINHRILTLSPMRGKDFLSGEKHIKDSYEATTLATEKGINTRDYFDVRRADAILVSFLGATKVSIGTVMEVAWARAFNKPVVCCMERSNIHQHSMLNYACGYIVEDLTTGIATLEALLLPDVFILQPKQKELI